MANPGLTERELARIEATYRFRFPPDLRRHLRRRQVGRLDWRTATDIPKLFARPYELLIADHADDDRWVARWGPRPAEREERVRFLHRAPRLIPLGGSNYIPELPHANGNPVFSLRYCSDVFVMGCDVKDFLAKGPRSRASSGWARHIPIWSDILYAWAGGRNAWRARYRERPVPPRGASHAVGCGPNLLFTRLQSLWAG